MLASLLLLTTLSTAQATEVGNGKNFGIGAGVGLPFTFTGKAWFSDQHALAFHVGMRFNAYLGGRVQYEGRVVEFADWPFADFGLYWDAGVFTRSWIFWAGSNNLQLGPTGGVGVELRFKDVPAAVYVESDLQMNVMGHDGDLGWMSFEGGAGGRWYF